MQNETLKVIKGLLRKSKMVIRGNFSLIPCLIVLLLNSALFALPTPVCYFDFNEGAGLTVYDQSGSSNDGTVCGAEWVDGRFGKALDFDGTSDYISILQSASLDIYDSITLEAWFKTSTQNGVILTKYSPGNNTGQEGGYSIAIRSGKVSLALAKQVYFVDYVGTNTVSTGTFHHIAGTYDGVSNTLKIYLDGNLEITNTFAFDILGPNTLDVQIGNVINPAITQDGRPPFKGIIDEVKVYNCVLTQAEIQEDMVPAYSIKGYVRDNSSTPVSGIEMNLTGDVQKSTVTTTSGFYQFLNLAGNGNYLVTPESDDYSFVPVNANYSVIDTNKENQNFIAIPKISTDTTGPVFSSIAASNISYSGSTITWITNEPATSQVEYGPSSGYGTLTTEDLALTITHNVALENLLQDSTYHYRVAGRDASNNPSTSSDYTFSTSPQPVVAPGIISITHPQQNVEYANSTARFTFSVAGSTPSDIAGYYYLVDGSLVTQVTPANGTFATWEDITISGLSDGIRYIHVIAKGSNNTLSAASHYRFIVHLAIDSSQDSEVTYSNGTTINIPAGAVSSNTTIEIKVPEISGLPQTGDIQIKASNIVLQITLADGTRNFAKDITIKVPYTAAQIQGLAENKLKLCYWSESALEWVVIPNSSVDTANKFVTANVNHLTIFRIIEYSQVTDKTIAYPNPCRASLGQSVNFVGNNVPLSIIKIYTVSGRIARTLNEAAGSNFINWDTTNDSGQRVSSGLYIYKISGPAGKSSGKLVITR
ncbi:MAG: hypothetical protein A2297_07580 [Elusimicrobia bacterium RIFOXYB2_FULL_48_7]|nr:MAG: hypothetical protein A2297_07580 [Elusimicrobia bacterium RIFOXYB2_FULL_48_7]